MTFIMKWRPAPKTPEFTAECPERQLMVAILERAILDLVELRRPGKESGARRCRAMHAQTARNWIHSTDRSFWNTYERICEVIGLDPKHLRDSDTIRQVVETYAQHARNNGKHKVIR